MDACENFVYICPAWTWKGVTDKSKAAPELPLDKQYISTKIVSRDRAMSSLDNMQIESVGAADGRRRTAGSRQCSRKTRTARRSTR